VATEEPGVETLPRADCDRLLASGSIGRVVLTDHALPVALPVNYAVDGADIVFRTGEGSKLAAARAGMVVAFEVDDFAPDHRCGWSVLVTGIARPLTDISEIVRADQLGIESWAPASASTYVRISTGLVSGRRIRAA